MSVVVGDRLLREGMEVHDRRYGPVTLLAVTAKTVWYRFENKNRTHTISVDAALRRFEQGTAFTIESNDEPRWTY